MMKRQYFAISLIGLNSICSQIILIREIIAIFSGNELTMGFVLASWFLWIAVGSTIGGKWKSKNKDSSGNRFAFFQTILPSVLIIQVIIIRQSRYIFRLPQIAMVGLGHIFWVSFCLLAPLCIILGLMFSLGYQWLSNLRKSPASRVGWVYVLEAVGAGAGGGLFSFLLIRIMSHIQICLLLGIVNLISALLIYTLDTKKNYAGIWISGTFIIFFTSLLLSSHFLQLDMLIYSYQWKDFVLLECKDSIYGRIALTLMNGEYSFYEHGVLTGTIPDLWTAEWRVHLPLIQHPEPKSLLLIGTGLASLNEALKYKSLNLIHYIELDPTALALAKRHCPPEYTESLRNPKVHPIYGDARVHLRETSNIYDAIILGLPDPKTAQINRMYTLEFFKLASDHLSGSGLIALSATSSENYIGPRLAEFLTCLYKTLKAIFPDLLVTPGDTAYFLAGKGALHLTLNPDIISQRLHAHNIYTAYFSEYYLPSQLTEERITTINNLLKDTSGVWINTDLKPVCYLYDLMLWGRYFSPVTGRMLEKAKKMDKKMLFVYLLFAILLAMSARFLGKEKSRRHMIALTVLIGGFIEIVSEILLVLSFQVFYGYAYLQLGILITGFMVGLSIGSFLMTYLLERLANAYQWLIGIQVSYLIYPLFLIFMFKSLDIGHWPARSVEFFFLLLTLSAGFIGGFQFPLSTKLFISANKKWKGQAGFLYGIDLIGSGAGAILASSFLVPLFGIQTAFGILSLMGGIGVLLLIINL